MEIQLNLEALRKRKIMICTLLFKPTPGYFRSMAALNQLFGEYKLDYVLHTLTNESDIPLARNKMSDTFLRSDCTDIVQIDDDVAFDPWDIIAFMHFDKAVIGANCPRKQIDWNLIKEAILLDPSIPVEKLPLMGATWMAAMSPDCKEIHPGMPLSVDSIPSGFSLIKKHVFYRLREHRSQFHVDDETKITDFWSSGPHDEKWETEDYAFCRRYREIGGKVWLCPWMQLNHEGFYSYPGDMLSALLHFSKGKQEYKLYTARDIVEVGR